jgi:two-component system chemotaxis response regulator CheV
MRIPDMTMNPPEKSHQAVQGAFNFKDRDRVIPLVDLAAYLGAVKVEDSEEKVIITEFNEVMTSFIVTGVTRIHRLSWRDIEKPDRLVDRYSEHAFTGVVRIDETVVFILDLEKVVIELNPRSALAFYGTEQGQIIADRDIHILHVDDQNLVRKMVKRSLENNARFHVHSAESGEDALNWLRARLEDARREGRQLEEYVDVIISDVEMPVMDGFTLCSKVKKDPDLRSVPLFLFSSLITEETMHKGESVGADGQFPKPQTEGMVYEMMTTLARKVVGEDVDA